MELINKLLDVTLGIRSDYDIINIYQHEDGVREFCECKKRGITFASPKAKMMKCGGMFLKLGLGCLPEAIVSLVQLAYKRGISVNKS